MTIRAIGKRTALAAVVLAAGLPLAASAQSHARADEAMAALKRNDCPAALAALRQGMLDNEPASFVISGYAAETGTCASADPAAAAKAYERAALLGRADAASSLALLYAQGSGVKQSYPEAGRWYAIAGGGANASAAKDASAFGSPDAVAKTYVRAVHDLAYFELANRLKNPYPVGARVRFEPKDGTATIVERRAGATGLPIIPDAEILASYRDAVGGLPKPVLPDGSFATERWMGSDDTGP